MQDDFSSNNSRAIQIGKDLAELKIKKLEDDYDAALMALNIAKKEIERYRNALQSYAYLADGDWYGPDDKYYNIGHTAREALGLDEPDEVYDYDGL